MDRIHASLAGGLSPRVRGNLTQVPEDGPDTRSIPACAGEPHGALLSALLYPVYPRVCGGTLLTAAPLRASCGLSPRVRGNRER